VHTRRLSSRRRGFTVIELLVTVGIIVLLAGIAIPMAMRAYRNAEVSRVRMDLQAISTALEAYKQDHGDYPRVPYPASDPPRNYVGANFLMWSLVAPSTEANDGADGPGFRTRPGGQGKVYGPYLKPEAFTLGKTDGSPPSADFSDAVLLDKTKKAVLYFPARASKPDLGQANSFVARATTADNFRPLYNAYDNKLIDLADMRRSLGDADADGRIDSGETAKYTGPFILWCAGPDGEYGNEDDITNFNE
jgi:prepilin-type N-terminal cleavage/methylation domain-containing protein